MRSQTISVDVTRQSWAGERRRAVEPIAVSPYFWEWWRFWCREYVVRGRLLCADGSPVPGATVCAHDVDWWFWWQSSEQVGCATTDINGAFEISFRACCGLWPWWWWEHRVWEFDATVAERITAVIERDPRLQLGRAKNQPSLGVFGELLTKLGIKSTGVLQAADANRLEQIRGGLLAKLPASSELEGLGVWPWAPWRPWWDCTPNLAFSATQNCGSGTTVILDEGFADVHWNISDPLEVTLTANASACCVGSQCADRPCPEGRCLVVTDVCSIVLDDISGNPGAPTAPELGLVNPGAVAPGVAGWAGDQPFAGMVDVHYTNNLLDVAYYEIEYSSTGIAGSFVPLPVAATPNLSRQYFDTLTTTWPSVAFPFQLISGHWVTMSREHYQTTPAWNPASDFWTVEGLTELVAIDSTKLPGGDGTYWFRVVGWEVDSGGNLINPVPLPVCDTEEIASWVLTFDNPPLAPPPYPDAQIVEVIVDGSSVDPCGVVAQSGGTLEVVFVAEDPDGWLGEYQLYTTYGLDQSTNLLALPSSALTVVSADCAGPTYGQSLAQAGSPGAPTWHGGRMSLTVDLDEAFPEPCCYQINLGVWTRHIANCSDSPPPYESSQWYTIGYGVCGDQTEPAVAIGAVDGA